MKKNLVILNDILSVYFVDLAKLSGNNTQQQSQSHY